MKRIFLYVLSIAFVLLAIASYTGHELLNVGPEGVIYGMLLFQAAGGVGVTTSYTMTWVPQFMLFDSGGNTPTSIKITVLGDGVIHDTVAAQLDLLGGGMRLLGRVANHFTIPLADGIIKGKNVTIDFTTSAVGAINVYGYSLEDGDTYVTTLQQTVLANSGMEFRKFAYLVIPAMGATDYVNIEFEDQAVQRFEQAELPSIAGFHQNLVAAQYIIDNIDGMMKMVQLIPAANRTVAVVRYVEAS